MHTKRFLISVPLLMLLAWGAHAQSKLDFAMGNVMFDAKAMDTDGDGMITRKEFMSYHAKAWMEMSKGAKTIPVDAAATAFARGNMKVDAQMMDADHDGSISRHEFMGYSGSQFDKMKNDHGMMSVDDAWTNFARGRPST